MTLSPQLQTLLQTIITEEEGGWLLTSNPNDADGGWTYAGVISATWQEWTSSNHTAAAFQSLLVTNPTSCNDTVLAIYENLYILPSHISSLPPFLQRPMLSCAINCGTASAIKILQQALSITPDGIWGPATASALSPSGAPLADLSILPSFRRAWQQHYISIATASADLWEAVAGVSQIITTAPKQWKNLQGWINRAEKATAAGAVAAAS